MSRRRRTHAVERTNDERTFPIWPSAVFLLLLVGWWFLISFGGGYTFAEVALVAGLPTAVLSFLSGFQFSRWWES